MRLREPVLIAGGGIGGCVLAIALLRRGVSVKIFERQDECREVGAGLSLWPNATRILTRLGLADEVDTLSGPAYDGGLFNSAGRVIARDSSDWITKRFGAPLIVVHRADLLRALVARLPPEILHTGSACVGFSQDASGVCLQLADGSEQRGAALIGAEGIHSRVRRVLGRPTETRYAGYMAWRAITTIQPSGLDPKGDWYGLYFGEGTQMGLAPVPGGRLYWFATLNAPAGTTAGPEGNVRELLDRFGHWPQPVVRTIEHLSEGAILRNDIIDLPPCSQWGEGRVSLLGDAAHAATPNLGQGACMAIEDGAVLADRLAATEDVAAGLRAYEADRVERSLRVVRMSWRVGQALQLQNKLLCWMRDSAMGMMSARSRLEQLAWLLEYDSAVLDVRSVGDTR